MKDIAQSRKSAEKLPKVSGRHRLGHMVFDADSGLLARGGEEIALRPKSLAVLGVLVARRGNVVSKQELLDVVWGETHVTEDSLVQCVTDIRRALGDDSLLLETYSRRGYRLKFGDKAVRPQPVQAIAFAGLAALVGILIWFASRPGVYQPPFDGRIAILVLPFEDYGVGDDAGYLGNAISEGVVADLSRFGEIAVVAASPGTAPGAAGADVGEMAAARGATFILHGNQRKEGDSLRIGVRLVRAPDGVTVWAETYDRAVADLFAMQADLVQSVAATVGYRLAYESPPQSDRGRVSALHYHIRGRNALQTGFDAETNAEFARWNELAIEADPDASWGWSGLGWYYRNAAEYGWNGLDREEALDRAVEHAERGLALGPDDYYAHFVRAGIHVAAGEIEAAIRTYDRAIELNPSASNAMVLSTSPLLYAGRTDDAIARIERAMNIDPFHPPWYNWQLAWALWQKGDCVEAEARLRRMSSISPPAHGMLAVILHCLGRIDEGRNALSIYARQQSDFSLAGERARLASIWQAAGQFDRWIAALRDLGAPP